jgi:hypothetical protein
MGKITHETIRRHYNFWLGHDKSSDSLLPDWSTYFNKTEKPTMQTLTDFPKIQCPFIRKKIPIGGSVGAQYVRDYGRLSTLPQQDLYLVVDQVNPGYEWVFEDKDTIAVEKLDGTNVKLKTENGRLVALQNRLNVIDPMQVLKGNVPIIEGVFTSIQKGYVEDNKEQVGELIGPKLQGNPYSLDSHIWFPFEKAITSLKYTSFHKHERNYDNFRSWFRRLRSLFFIKYNKSISGASRTDLVWGAPYAEGIIFYNLRRKEEGKVYMAKLRLDMFDWYYGFEIHKGEGA